MRWYVHDMGVVRINKTTVSVKTGHSWTDRIPHGRIVDVRHGEGGEDR